MANLKKKKKQQQPQKQIKHEFNKTKWQTLGLIFTTVYFSRNFITCRLRFITCVLRYHCFTESHQISYLPRFILFFLAKWNTFTLFNMAGPRMRMVSIPFLIINDVIMTSIVLLRFTYVLANFLNRRE